MKTRLKLNDEHAYAIESLIQQQASLQQSIANATASRGRLTTALAAQAAMLQHEYGMPDGHPAFGVEEGAWVLVVTSDPAPPSDGTPDGDPPMGKELSDA